MSEKTSCSVCGHPLLLITARLTGGLCRPCHTKREAAAAAAIAEARERGFDPHQKRKSLLEQTPEPADNLTAAGFLLTDAVYASLSGLPRRARHLAELAERGLACGAIFESAEEREPRLYYQLAGEATRLRQLALARWLLSDGEDTLSLRKAIDCRERSFAEGRSLSPRADAMELDTYLADCVQAGEYMRGIHAYEREDPQASEPIKLGRALSIRRVCYAVCRHFGLGDSDQSELLKSLDALLKRRMHEWLSNGHSIDAAAALKIRFRHVGGPEEPSVAILLRAYDYLPRLRAPIVEVG